MNVERRNHTFVPITMTIENATQLRVFMDLLEVAFDESDHCSEVERLAEDLQKKLQSVQ